MGKNSRIVGNFPHRFFVNPLTHPLAEFFPAGFQTIPDFIRQGMVGCIRIQSFQHNLADLVTAGRSDFTAFFDRKAFYQSV